MRANGIAFGANCGETLDATVTSYLPALYRVALRRLGNHEVAEDAVQDALLSAFKHSWQFENRSRLSTWLYRIVTNAAGTELRRRRRRTFRSLDDVEGSDNMEWPHQLIEPGFSPEQDYGRAELRENFHQLVSQLAPKLRKALELRHIKGFSTVECAQLQGITQSAAKTRAHRGRAQLSKLAAGTNIVNGGSKVPNSKRNVQSEAIGWTDGSREMPRYLMMIRKTKHGYQVLSNDGTDLGGPYKTLEEAMKIITRDLRAKLQVSSSRSVASFS